MNITRTDIDALNATINLHFDESDYSELVEKELKKLRQKANVPGFRPGMVPMGMIKKMYGRSVKADELNKLIQQKLFEYVKDLDILCEPLPNVEDESRAIDFENDKEFDFKFDIALAPAYEPVLNKNTSIKYYNITVTDEMIDNQVKNYGARFGNYSQVEELVDKKDMLKGNILELDAEGKVVETGIKVDDAVLSPAYIKDEEQQKLFENVKKGSVIVFNPKKAFENVAEISSMLKISKEKAEVLSADFRYEVTSITHYEESPIDQSLFDKVYGEGVVKTEEEFKSKVAEGIKESYVEDSKFKFGIDAKAAMIKKMDKLEFPEAFLKRWLLATNENMSEETLEKDFPAMLEDLKWYICKSKIASKFEIKVEDDDIKNFARRMTRIQFAQYGMTGMPDDILDNYAKNMLSKDETRRNVIEKTLEDKVFDVIKNNVKVVDTTVSVEEFNKLFE